MAAALAENLYGIPVEELEISALTHTNVHLAQTLSIAEPASTSWCQNNDRSLTSDNDNIGGGSGNRNDNDDDATDDDGNKDTNNIDDDDEKLSNDVSLSDSSLDSGLDRAETTEAEDKSDEDRSL